MKQIEDYSKEEIISLCKRLSIYATAWFFKYYRTYKMKDEEKEEPFIEREFQGTEGYKKATYYIFFKKRDRSDVQYQLNRLNKDRADYETKHQRLLYTDEAYRMMIETVYWFRGGHEEYIQEYQNYAEPEQYESPEEREETLSLSEDVHIKNGLATDYQTYQFVWETLQYLNIEQLNKLLKYADYGIKHKWEIVSIKAGRKSRKCVIQQIDIETGSVVKSYETRNEVIYNTGIKKSHLSQCIKTSMENPNNMKQWKKWIATDDRKYGFVELPITK